MTPTIQDILRFYTQYYSTTRGVGHTRAMIRGADKEDCIVLCASSREATHAEQFSPHSCAYSQIERLTGRRVALAWDNHALFDLFSAASREMRSLAETVEVQRVDLRFLGTEIMLAYDRIERLQKAAKKRRAVKARKTTTKKR